MHSVFTEAFVLGMFLTIVSLILAGFFNCVGRIVRLGWEESKFVAKDYIALVLGFVGFACFGYGLAEPYQLVTTIVSITSKKIAPGSKPIRIVHLTDLHCSFLTGPLMEKLPKTIAALKPDIIVFTGDAFNDVSGRASFADLLKELPKIAPTFCVRGNHDYSDDGSYVYDKTDVHYLDSSADWVVVRGTKIWIAGVGTAHEEQIEALLSRAPNFSAFTMFLYHYPIGLRNAVAHNFDLFCGGHTHGGQVRLPWYGALLTNSELGKKYEYGLFKEKETSIFISRGIGTIGIPVRFLAPPEVAVIDVYPESK